MRVFACLALAVLATGSGAGADTARRGWDVDPQISPGGRYILYLRVYPGGSRYTPAARALMVANADGGGERVLVPTTDRPFAASWGPGALVSVTRDRRTELLRPEDGAVARTLPIADDPAWSPNGRRAAYSTGRELVVVNGEGSDARTVAASHRLGWVQAGEWSPDSTRVTYAIDLPRRFREASEVVKADGSGRRRLRVAPSVSSGSWAPSGRAIVLGAQGDVRRPTRYEPPRLFMVRLDGSHPRVLVRGHASSPAWSPTGRRIAYVRQIPGRGTTPDRLDLMLVRPDGSGVQRIARVEYGARPVWYPDGRHIAISRRGRCPDAGIHRLDVVRRTVTRLTNSC
jgi:Tol biopolymer transport system component